MNAYKGTCHCGAISFEFERDEITNGLRCNCSICVRKGAVMSAFVIPPDELHIEAEAGSLGTYEFGTNTAKHFFCRKCGIYPFHQTLRKPGHYRVNLGCIDDIDINSISIDVFDGRSI